MKNNDDIFEKLIPLNQSKIAPGAYDWLSHNYEPGQNFEEYIRQKPVIPSKDKNVIYIAKLGDFNKKHEKIIDITVEFISIYFGLPVKYINPIPLSTIPENARRIHPQTNDKQILTTYVIDEILKPKLPNDGFCLIAFTTSDLWPGSGWNFVFGQASIEDRVGIWSIYRNGDPLISKKDYDLCLMRTLKTGVHEIGHMFSLYHCIYFECVMNGSNHRKESDNRPLWLCPVCLKKLEWAIRFNQEQRFRNLINFTFKLNMKREEEFYKNSLKYILNND